MLRSEREIRAQTVEIPCASPDYPAAWKLLPDPPQTLFAIGDISLLRSRRLAVVGARRTPQNALKLGGEIVKALSAGLVIVTGVADGGDTAAIEGALQGSGRVICLLAGGFSSLPQCNLSLIEKVAARGLLLSPHPFETQVRSFSYEYRNKLLAAFCEGVFVLGAGEKSGALITARYAVLYGKPVFALPYPPNASYGCGCNGLIKQGGYLVENAEDIAWRYQIDLKKRESVPLSEEESLAYNALKERGESHVSELASATKIPPFKLRGVLSSLEVKGLVTPLGGNRYAAV